MPTPINEVVHYLRSTLFQHDEAGLTDGRLLSRFIEHRDQTAVAALVRRHGPMIWGVCRRVLGNEHDAEDAFQATFLVLIRKAASVRQRELVGNWLYGVAHQTALKARANRAQRRTRERQVTDMPEITSWQPDASCDLQALLDQELSRLPEKYRIAIVLCDLEGRTRREVARQLGLPEGTLAGRLTRGRALLARRLSSRGVAVSGGTLTAVWAQQTATAGVPTALLSSTIEAVTGIAAGQAAMGLVSAQVAGLSEGVVKAMLLSKLKIATVVLFVMAAVGAGVASRARDGQTQATEPAAAEDTIPPKDKRVPEARKIQSDKEAIQGRWKVVACEIGGWNEPEEYAGVRITGDKFFFRQKGSGAFTEYTYTLEPTHKPKRIDLVGTQQVQKRAGSPEEETRRFTSQGIYHLDGDDLALCFRSHHARGNRPTRFETQSGDGRTLLMLRRERPIVTPEGGERVIPKGVYEPKGPATNSEPGKTVFLDVRGRVVKNPRTGELEVELQIPKADFGKVLATFDPFGPGPGIYVLVILTSAPTRFYSGTLALDRIQAETDRRGPAVLAWVSVPDPRNPRRSLLNPEDQQSEVHVRIYLGKQAQPPLPRERTADGPGTGAAPAPAKPDVVFRTESRHIRLPVRVFGDQRARIEELQLFASSDEGKTWRYVAYLGREGDTFDFEAPHDGVYWFSVRTLNNDGTAEPRDLSALSATLKLQVAAEATKPPEKPKPPQFPQKSVEELKAEVKALRRQLRQIEQRLSEMERAK